MIAFKEYEYLAARKEHFQLAIPTLAQRRGKVIGFDLESLVWSEAKFLQDDGTALHNDMGSIPNDSGGIYIFHVKSDVLPSVIKYTMYIGRAQNTNTSYSLRSRCRSYFNDERLSIQKMIHYWGPYLYISYTPLTDNTLIIDLEKWLIASVLPVYNPKIDDVDLKEPKKMFYP